MLFGFKRYLSKPGPSKCIKMYDPREPKSNKRTAFDLKIHERVT